MTQQPQGTQRQTPIAALMAQPTAWQSLPAVVRFAVWVWAIATIAGVAVGWLVAVVVFGLR